VKTEIVAVKREFSAGGVLVRRLDGRWMMAAIRPQRHGPAVWALPKGHIDEGERGEATALREVAEETGVQGHSLGKLGDVRYWFNRDGERIFKVVSFFLVRYVRGRLGDLSEAFRHEVAEVRWVPLEEAPKLLTYGGEKDIARKAWERLSGEGV
jgi:8-oxo-dGTP pyrophosphatase MutT (NUDIX family)